MQHGSGLYIHVPFCRRKCDYCDFFSLPVADGVPADYPGLLLEQLRLTAPVWPGPLTTVFFGGGTPSLLEPAAVARLIDAAAARFGLAGDAEISLEANPGTVDPERLRAFHTAGVNRLSLGIQSFSDRQLVALGRLHDRRTALRAVEQARRAGFDNLALDLIFALPGQTAADLEREMGMLLSLAPEHVSCYGLSVEEGTPLAARHRHKPLALPDEERFAELYSLAAERLGAAGYRHYEISNHARPGFECRHNLGYWRRRSCLGLGPGAHSFRADGWGERLAIPPDLERYAAELRSGREPSVSLECFDRSGAMAETLYLGLRTADGVADTAFRERFGCSVAEAFPVALRQAGARLTLIDGRWRFDRAGWLLYDHLITPFLVAPDSPLQP